MIIGEEQFQKKLLIQILENNLKKKLKTTVMT